MNYQLHPLCTLFPRVEGKAFADLINDIASNGLREAIVLQDGMILDGGNRYRACEAANVIPHFVEFEGDSIASYVLSKNLHRRHLTEGQRAAIVASTTDWEKTLRHGQTVSQSRHVASLSTQSERAATAGVSERTQQRAERVAKASPEKIQEVARGEKTLPQAVREISQQKPKQDDVIEYFGPSDEEIEAAREAAANDNEKLNEILAGDDALADAFREIKRLKSELAIVKLSRDGYMNQLAEVLSKFKSIKRKLDKLQA
jgi:hypothetical protein